MKGKERPRDGDSLEETAEISTTNCDLGRWAGSWHRRRAFMEKLRELE